MRSSVLRADPKDTFGLPRPSALPADPSVVVSALSPLITEGRLKRIEAVIAARTRSVVPVLDGLIDSHNIAAVLRSADAFGVQDVHVIEAHDQPFVASHRVAQGTERWLDIVRHDGPEACAQQLRERGYRILVASMDGEVGPADLRRSQDPVAVVFGNEHAGVSSALTNLADATYGIPMRGFVESLNVSVANAITLQAATEGRAGDLSADARLQLRARFMMLSVERADEIVAEHRRRCEARAPTAQGCETQERHQDAERRPKKTP